MCGILNILKIVFSKPVLEELKLCEILVILKNQGTDLQLAVRLMVSFEKGRLGIFFLPSFLSWYFNIQLLVAFGIFEFAVIGIGQSKNETTQIYIWSSVEFGRLS